MPRPATTATAAPSDGEHHTQREGGPGPQSAHGVAQVLNERLEEYRSAYVAGFLFRPLHAAISLPLALLQEQR